ncbi:hypothetical protein [Pasteuria penetrans]|uniref:hypothetical protein n=1 Tax=Pasteuria penetrans TaxID=86005 RepID=UPI0011EEE263|nr:hypothetical protein [Pasteuria penetrans]
MGDQYSTRDRGHESSPFYIIMLHSFSLQIVCDRALFVDRIALSMVMEQGSVLSVMLSTLRIFCCFCTYHKQDGSYYNTMLVFRARTRVSCRAL